MATSKTTVTLTGAAVAAMACFVAGAYSVTTLGRGDHFVTKDPRTPRAGRRASGKAMQSAAARCRFDARVRAAHAARAACVPMLTLLCHDITDCRSGGLETGIKRISRCESQ